MSDLEQRVIAITAQQLGKKPEDLQSESSFMDDLGADSLDLVELVMSFESEFDITIPDEDSSKIITIQSAVDYIASKIA